ncbi:retrovirus-related Pol polyprotein from transposon 412 [Trichonephila clavipes]|nr:retrovirus-related Pol polyprotein from transposon 412 [Trichonephila clavipes]
MGLPTPTIRLKFNPSKCQFLTKSCKFLGFVVTPEGILIDKDKSVSINEFPVPKDQKQIKSFLGCCNFYRRYIKNFAKRALPLTNLLRKDTPFEWTSETQEAFDDIKKAILNPPVLALPDQNADGGPPFHKDYNSNLYTDPVVVYKPRNFWECLSPHRKRVTHFPRLEKAMYP